MNDSGVVGDQEMDSVSEDKLRLQVYFSQFHQRFKRAFFVLIFQQSQNVTRKTTFVRKIRTYNVEKIKYFLRSGKKVYLKRILKAQ